MSKMHSVYPATKTTVLNHILSFDSKATKNVIILSLHSYHKKYMKAHDMTFLNVQQVLIVC